MIFETPAILKNQVAPDEAKSSSENKKMKQNESEFYRIFASKYKAKDKKTIIIVATAILIFSVILIAFFLVVLGIGNFSVFI